MLNQVIIEGTVFSGPKGVSENRADFVIKSKDLILTINCFDKWVAYCESIFPEQELRIFGKLSNQYGEAVSLRAEHIETDKHFGV